MNVFNYNDFLNENKKIDYNKKFGKKIDEINKIINQAKKDDIQAIETDSTLESEYSFDKVILSKTKLKVYYKEGIPSKKKIDEVNLTIDRENDFEEANYMFQWIKKTIKKGYREAKKEQVNESTFFNKIELNNFNIEHDYGRHFNWYAELDDLDFDGTIIIPEDERGLVDIDWNTSGKLPDYWKELEKHIEKETNKYIGENDIDLEEDRNEFRR